MKTKTPPAGKSQKAAAAADASQTPINIAPEEGKMLRECAGKLGQTVPEFVHTVVMAELGKLSAIDPFAIPCPFCGETDSLETMEWSHELLDGTEYYGPSMRCDRCVTVTALPAWIKRGMALSK